MNSTGRVDGATGTDATATTFRSRFDGTKGEERLQQESGTTTDSVISSDGADTMQGIVCRCVTVADSGDTWESHARMIDGKQGKGLNKEEQKRKRKGNTETGVWSNQ